MNTLWIVLVITNFFTWHFTEDGKSSKNHLRTEREYFTFSTKDEAVKFSLSLNPKPSDYFLIVDNRAQSEIVVVEIMEATVKRKFKASIVTEKIQ